MTPEINRLADAEGFEPVPGWDEAIAAPADAAEVAAVLAEFLGEQ